MSLNDINPVEVADDENRIEFLPINWQETTLGEICPRIVDGSHNPPKAQSDGLPMLSAKNIQGRRITFDDPRLISNDDFEIENLRTNISINDVLMTIVGAIGRTAVVTEAHKPFTLQRSVAVLKNPYTNSKLLAYFLESPELQNHFSENAKGTAQKGIYLKALSQTPFPLPPLAEQVRIADKLDALLARVEAGRERLERVPKLLKRFRQSVLSAAVSGELTREWRGGDDPKWKETTLGEVVSQIGNGLPGQQNKNGVGIPVTRIETIATGEIDLDRVGYIDSYKDDDLNKHKLIEGDILFSHINSLAHIGKTAIFKGSSNAVYHGINLLRIVPSKSAILPSFLHISLQNIRLSRYYDNVAQQAVNQASLNQKQLRLISIALPTIPEQTEIVRRVEALFAIADRIEAKYAAALSSFDRLTPALLAKAFRGELVPQDPNDEPASVLLERIRAAREAEGGKRGRGRPAKATAGSGDGTEVKRRGRPPGANAQAGAEGTEPKRRGRPPKVREAVSEPDAQPAAVPEAVEASAAPRGRGRPPGPGIPQASSFEDALRKLEEQKLARAQGARQVGLFDDAE